MIEKLLAAAAAAAAPIIAERLAAELHKLLPVIVAEVEKLLPEVAAAGAHAVLDATQIDEKLTELAGLPSQIVNAVLGALPFGNIFGGGQR
ncbi:hypothetical protein I5G67_gp102 [Mycobacterium phage Aminay]|uniref:Uncharacterized protein n=1 Tax=Mycobacterium phage Aminay TaxID=2250291 RepID=A0A345KV86_9CAUD|nr:hypothetical protein I5G67_gp102 [Mycobacterium phage Aminay]AXH46938.1 hypothetical protein SEA_AMINAY_102 [Mycobacterium phage Aminay]